jgi:nitroreductase
LPRNLKLSQESSANRRSSLIGVSIDELIRGRRTHKAYDPQPVDRATLEELFELARWAPNHNLTNPWRFRVLGPESLAALKEAAGPEAAGKLERAPTLIAASVVRSDEDAVTDEEDFAAAAVATFIVLLGAHARGLGGYWRTPAVLRTPEGRAALGIPAGERVLGLIHLGRAKGPEKLAPERAPVDEIRSYLP